MPHPSSLGDQVVVMMIVVVPLDVLDHVRTDPPIVPVSTTAFAQFSIVVLRFDSIVVDFSLV